MSPQCEDGFTRIANELIEALALIRIPGESMQIFLVILRKTYGFGKKEDRISLAQFTETTGIPKPRIVRALAKLLDMKIIVKSGSGHYPNYGVNKYHGTWEKLPKKAINIAIEGNAMEPLDNTDETVTYAEILPCMAIKEKLPKKAINIAIEGNAMEPLDNTDETVTYAEILPCMAIKEKLPKKAINIAIEGNAVAIQGNLNCLVWHPQKKKETITKEKRNIGEGLLPICLAWRAFQEMRRQKKKPLSGYAEVLIVKKLMAFHANGHDPVDVLNASIENSWQGVFEPKQLAAGKQTAAAVRESNHNACREFANE